MPHPAQMAAANAMLTLESFLRMNTYSKMGMSAVKPTQTASSMVACTCQPVSNCAALGMLRLHLACLAPERLVGHLICAPTAAFRP